MAASPTAGSSGLRLWCPHCWGVTPRSSQLVERHLEGAPSDAPGSTPTLSLTLAGQGVLEFSRLLELVVNHPCPILEVHMYPLNYLFEIIVGTELK